MEPRSEASAGRVSRREREDMEFLEARGSWRGGLLFRPAYTQVSRSSVERLLCYRSAARLLPTRDGGVAPCWGFGRI